MLPIWLEFQEVAGDVIPLSPGVIWNDLGYDVYGSLTFVSCFCVLCVMLSELLTPSGTPSRTAATATTGARRGAKYEWWKRMTFLSILTLMICNCLLILSGFFFREAAFWLWACFVTNIHVFCFFGLVFSRNTILRMLNRTGSKKSITTVLGGRWVILSFEVFYILTTALISIGGFGMAAALSFPTPPAVDVAVVFYRLHCVAMGSWVFTFILLAYLTFQALAKEVEDSVKAAAGLLRDVEEAAAVEEEEDPSNTVTENTSPGENNSSNAAVATNPPPTTSPIRGKASSVGLRREPSRRVSTNASQRQLEVARRLRSASILFLLVLPIGTGVLYLQAAILPMYWFLALMHLNNAMMGCVACWYTFTAPERRRRVVRNLLPWVLVSKMVSCGEMVINNNPSSASSSKRGKEENPPELETNSSPDAKQKKLGSSNNITGEGQIVPMSSE